MRDTQEIMVVILRLKHLKSRIKERLILGSNDSNHDIIDLQVRVLESEWDQADVSKLIDKGEFPEQLIDYVTEAVDWKYEVSEEDDLQILRKDD